MVNMYFKLIVFSISVWCVHTAPNNTCTTSNGEEGTCVPFFSCPVVYESVERTFKDVAVCKKYGGGLNVCCNGPVYFVLPNTTEVVKSESETVDEIESIILNEIDSVDLPSRDVCGIHANDDRILADDLTGYDVFPWVVPLVYQSELTSEDEDVRCVGSIINKRFVLTSAGCTSKPGSTLVKVRLGEWNLTSDPDCAECDLVQVVKIAEIIRHPHYDSVTSDNDIALLRLEKNIEYTDLIGPVCLPAENLPDPEDGRKLVVSGWGITNDGVRSDVKLKTSLQFVSNERCKQALPHIDINSNNICAGRNACLEDSGGPLVRRFLDLGQAWVQWYQEGITSQGVQCGSLGSPQVYTKVKKYISWILESIKSK